MIRAIKNKLKEIEQEHKVKILYACETGSRAWGFPSPDSDYDIRMIYMHELDWYLSLAEKEDAIDMMLDDEEMYITGWDFRKCLRLLGKSNGALLERFQSPIIYHQEEGFITRIHEYTDKCFSPSSTLHHYLGLAKKHFNEINDQEDIRLKSLFNSLRATLACKWVLEKDTIPPMVFQKMLDEIEFEEPLKARIRFLIELKSKKIESYIHPAEKELTTFLKQQINAANSLAGKLKGKRDNDIDLDVLFRTILKKYEW